MKSCAKILDEIRLWVNRYHAERNSGNINRLLDIQDEIAVRSLTLATYVSEYKTSYNAHYFIRKVAVAKSALNYQKNGMLLGKSEQQALIDNRDQYEMEQSHEATAVQLELFLRQTNILLESIRQRISYLKRESETQKN